MMFSFKTPFYPYLFSPTTCEITAPGGNETYLSLMKICIGVPVKSHFSRILFSRKRR